MGQMDLGSFFKPKEDNNPQNLTVEKPGCTTHAFSGIGRHLRKIGSKNIETGIGHGIGFGTACPAFLHLCECLQNVAKIMTKFGASQTFGQSILTTSILSRTSKINQNPPFGPKTNMMQYLAKSSFSNRTEKDMSKFQQNLVQPESSVPNKINVEQLQSENRMLQMVLKHEQVIEELMEENERFRRILVEDLQISPAKLHSKHSSDTFEGHSKLSRR
ncbi:hypothetical protein V2J09_000182 [Rumex salicifolius]